MCFYLENTLPNHANYRSVLWMKRHLCHRVFDGGEILKGGYDLVLLPEKVHQAEIDTVRTVSFSSLISTAGAQFIES